VPFPYNVNEKSDFERINDYQINRNKDIAYVKDIATNHRIIVSLCNENHGAFLSIFNIFQGI
jgi:general stress protein 26